MLQEEQRPVVDARGARAKAPGKTEGVGLLVDVFLLLLPFHAKGGIGQHVVEGPPVAVGVTVKAVGGEGVAEDDIVGVLALDQHVGLAHRPSFVVPVLAVKVRAGVAVEVTDVLLGHREHAAGAAGGVVDGLDHIALGQIPLRGQQQVDHQLDHLAGGEVLPGLFVGLFRADPDQLLEHITHLHLIDPLGRKVYPRKSLDHLEEDVLLRHVGDLLTELELLHDGADVGGEAVDVAIQIWCEVVGVVQQRVDLFARQGELHARQVVEAVAGDLLQACLLDTLGPGLQRLEFFKDGLPGRLQQALEAAQHRQREDDLAVLVALVGAAQQVADGPDKTGQLGVGFSVHFILTVPSLRGGCQCL